MKNKLRVGALLLTAVMLVSGVYESAPIVVRAEEQTEIEQEALTDGEKQENGGGQGETETTDVLVAEVNARQQVYGKNVAFDSTSDWDEQGEKDGYDINLTTETALHEGAYVTMDIVLPGTPAYAGSIKVQGIARLGSGWSWKQSNVIPELKKEDFKKLDDNNSVATIKIPFDESIKEDVFKQLTIKVVGYQCNYAGPIYIENVKLYDKQTSGEQPSQPEKPILPEKDPRVIDDFEDGICEDWKNGGVWQYTNSIVNSVAKYNSSQMMKVDLDYTGMGSYSWSEAKLENKITDGFDISAYNLLNFDYYYPAASSRFSPRV